MDVTLVIWNIFLKFLNFNSLFISSSKQIILLQKNLNSPNKWITLLNYFIQTHHKTNHICTEKRKGFNQNITKYPQKQTDEEKDNKTKRNTWIWVANIRNNKHKFNEMNGEINCSIYIKQVKNNYYRYYYLIISFC